MTNLCGGGASGPKPGAPGVAAFTATLITEALAAAGLAGAIVAALIDGFIYDTSEHCTTDPPALPVWDFQDAVNLQLGYTSPTWSVTNQKLTALLQHYAWYLYCGCTDGTAPPPFRPPLPPPGVGTTSSPTIQPCFTAAWSGKPIVTSGNPLPNSTLDVGPQLLPVTSLQSTLMTWNGFQYPAYPVKQSISTSRWWRKLATPVNGYEAMQPMVRFLSFDASHTFKRTHQTGGYSTDLPSTLFYAWPEPPVYMAAIAYYDAGITPSGFTDLESRLELQMYCGGSTGLEIDSCCPPDPSIMLALNTIIQLLRVSKHIDGYIHAGLTGAGSVQLQAAVDAIRVDVKTDLAGWPNNPGDPNYYYSLGFITSFAATSPLKGWRLVYGSQTFPIVQYADQIGYTLPPGVSVDVVELLPAS